ncbi:enoyl-CoA hydratase/isomerase family protein [Streptomyces sp. NPDC005708]|uniref:enoyl-CoA hydratase/isomerase family protein n=1 Tax=Streptomyces sp. NPDC005708 TaxID=3154564 RepID=UPI0034111258
MTSRTLNAQTWSGEVRTTVEASVATVVIDNGPQNLLNPGVMASLEAMLKQADADPEVTGILLTGDGATFCGGLDIPAIQAGADPTEFARALVAVLRAMPGLATPVAALVNGDALASGASLVAACDYAVVVPEARVGSYEVSVAVWPMIAQVPLIQRIGPRAAMENIGAGEPFTAERAFEVGLVQGVATLADASVAVRRWLANAARAGDAAPGRRSLYELAELSYGDALDASLSRFVAQFEGEA